jgi:anti-sigma factor RsiW
VRISERMNAKDHDQKWSDLLDDWLDDALAPAEREAFAAHLAHCERCSAALDELTALDRELSASLPPLQLDSAFDARLFERIDSENEASRLAARERAKADIEQELQALARQWRRTFAAVVPGIAAGIALAFAGVGYFDAAGWTSELADAAATAFGADGAALIKALLTSGIGAGIGYTIARWLAQTAR